MCILLLGVLVRVGQWLPRSLGAVLDQPDQLLNIVSCVVRLVRAPMAFELDLANRVLGDAFSAFLLDDDIFFVNQVGVDVLQDLLEIGLQLALSEVDLVSKLFPQVFVACAKLKLTGLLLQSVLQDVICEFRCLSLSE